MNTITLKGNISEEQYNRAIKDLEAIGLTIEISDKNELPEEVLQDIEIGWKQLRTGQGIPSSEVYRKARILCRKE